MFCTWSTHTHTKSQNLHLNQSFCFMPAYIKPRLSLPLTRKRFSGVQSHSFAELKPCGHDEHTENRAKQIQHCLNDRGLSAVRELPNWPARSPSSCTLVQYTLTIMLGFCIEAMLGSLQIHDGMAWGGCHSFTQWNSPQLLTKPPKPSYSVGSPGFSWNQRNNWRGFTLFHLVPSL